MRFRWIIVTAAFIMTWWNAADGDLIGLTMWSSIAVLNLMLAVEESIKEHIDKKFKELKGEE
jgi:hypothetical protein